MESKQCCVSILRDDPQAQQQLAKNWGWLLFTGALVILLGMFAIGAPILTGLAAATFLGALFLVSGIAETVHAFKCRKRGGFGWQLLGSLLTVAVGVVLFANPFSGLVMLTIFVGVALAMRGVGQISLAFTTKGTSGWGWLLFSGAVSLLLAAMMLFQFGIGSLAIVGLLVGIEFIFRGWAMVGFAFTLRQLNEPRRPDLQPAT